jgi:poly(A) polymerase
MTMDLPTADEKKATELLLAELRRQKTFEAPAETEKRYAVLSTLKYSVLT